MNIFVLDVDPFYAAKAHCDKHVPKMILESAQMLSTVLGGPYKPTHANHPCTLWVAESRANAEWLWELMGALDIEYATRWHKDVSHKSYDAMRPWFKEIKKMSGKTLTPFAQAMPDEFKNDNAVEAYRAYYRSKPFVSWNKGPEPTWW